MDSEKIEHLYKKYSKDIQRYLNYKFGSRISIEDVLSETFERLLRKEPNFDIAKEKQKSWLISTARNISMEQLRSIKKQAHTQTSEQSEDLDSDLFHNLVRENSLDLLAVAIKELSHEEQEIFMLRVVDGYSLKEISHITGIKYEVIKKKYQRTQGKLKKNIARKNRLFVFLWPIYLFIWKTLIKRSSLVTSNRNPGNLLLKDLMRVASILPIGSVIVLLLITNNPSVENRTAFSSEPVSYATDDLASAPIGDNPSEKPQPKKIQESPLGDDLNNSSTDSSKALATKPPSQSLDNKLTCDPGANRIRGDYLNLATSNWPNFKVTQNSKSDYVYTNIYDSQKFLHFSASPQQLPAYITSLVISIPSLSGTISGTEYKDAAGNIVAAKFSINGVYLTYKSQGSYINDIYEVISSLKVPGC